MAAWFRRRGRLQTDALPNDLTDDQVAPGVPSRALLESMQANVVVADAHLNIVYVNPRASQTLAALGAEVEKAFRV